MKYKFSKTVVHCNGDKISVAVDGFEQINTEIPLQEILSYCVIADIIGLPYSPYLRSLCGQASPVHEGPFNLLVHSPAYLESEKIVAEELSKFIDGQPPSDNLETIQKICKIDDPEVFRTEIQKRISKCQLP